MAAKQGLSAHISQASEDAKRAVLNRTSLKSSLWFSNLNTTCTIKSAPPRSPEVLELLATKTGYLFKRNEQHVWQSRWCCVVPHTFLYYFDVVHPNTVSNTAPPKLTARQQEALNQAVQHGYGKRGEAKQQQPRSSLYHVLGGGTGTSAVTTSAPQDASAPDNAPLDSASLQPAGIIDLECYTTIHRNSQNDLLLELAGDETVNPDLRSFYFCATSETEGEDWTQALLSQRHSSLVDEKEAYRQVCDGFAQQLQMLHSQLDDAQLKEQEQQDELYRVRSQMEDTRRSCWRLVRDTLERGEPTALAAKKAYRTDLEAIQSQDQGLLSAVQLLCDYTQVLEETCSDCSSKISTLESKLEQQTQGDETKVQQLEAELSRLKADMAQQQVNWHAQLETLQQKYHVSKKERDDLEKELANQKVEMTMYKSSTRTKMNEWKEQKRVLKNEVLKLRADLKNLAKELNGSRKKQSAALFEAEQYKQKVRMMEPYIEKIESHVKMQHSMMEMMSAAGSVCGGEADYQQHFDAASTPGMVGRTVRTTSTPSRGDYSSVGGGLPRSTSPFVPRKTTDYEGLVVNPQVSVNGNGDDDDNADQGAMPHPIQTTIDGDFKPLPQRSNSVRRGVQSNGPNHKNNNSSNNNNNNDDDDNKSHVSELTEDRTQKQFDAAYLYQQQHIQRHPATQNLVSPRSAPLQTTQEGPPAVIGVSYEQQQQEEALKQEKEQLDQSSSTPKLDTIMSVHSTQSLSKVQGQTSSSRSRNDLSRLDNASRNSSSTPPVINGMTTVDSGSLSSFGSKPKLSVAQRARLEADRQATPVKVRVDPASIRMSTPVRNNTASPGLAAVLNRGETIDSNDDVSTRNGSSPSKSVRSGFWRTLERAVDNSFLGVGDVGNADNESGSDRTDSYAPSGYSEASKYLNDHQEEKKISETASEASANVSMSLAERQALQRAQQLQFLKNQGLISNEEQVRGGPGGTKTSETGSTVSSSSYQTSPLTFGRK